MDPKDTQKKHPLYKCTNVAFAAYLELHGHHVTKLDVQAQGKGIFWFDVDPETLNELRCKWNGSPEANFNDLLNRLKSLTY
jgi:hypothetical protein